MSITYADHAANPDRLWSIHGKRGDRVLGFMVVDYDKDVETLYALDNGNGIRRTHQLNRPVRDFNKAGRAWFAAAAIPDDAEFIGSYPYGFALDTPK